MPRSSYVPRSSAAPKRRKRVYRKSVPSLSMVPVARVRGRGDYTYAKPGPWGKAGRWIGSALGSHFAGSGGGKLGEKLGSYLHYIGKIFGSGDYVQSSVPVVHNTLISGDKLSPQIPQFGSNQTVHIRHREYLGDVVSSATANTFNINSYSINPGLMSSFPWLSQVCGASFQQYRVNGMVFEFRTMSADALNSTNTALGSVVMATDYDSADAAFTSKAQMENSEFGVSSKPSACMLHAIECKKSLTAVSELYIRAQSNPSGTDIRMYDLGKFYIATTGFQGTSVNCGELWVSYDITLIKTIQQPPGYTELMLHRNLSVTDGTKPLNPDTSVYAQPLFDNIGVAIDSTFKIMTFPILPINTRFMLIYALRGTSTASVTSPGLTVAGGMEADYEQQNNASTFYAAPQAVNTSTTTIFMVTLRQISSVAGGTVTFNTITTPPAAAAGDLWVIQLNSVSPYVHA